MRNLKVALPAFILVVIGIFITIWYTRAHPEKPAEPVKSAAVRIGPADIYPDPVRTPGATNPDIIQDTLRETICNPRWKIKSIRPPASYTNRLKMDQIGEYGYSDPTPKAYEEDHFIPLELGGHPSDPRNLWPEPYLTSIPDGGVRAKNKVENYLHAQVCSGSLTLEQAQNEITEDWYRVYTTSVPH